MKTHYVKKDTELISNKINFRTNKIISFMYKLIIYTINVISGYIVVTDG